jgi:DNA-binding transcriptional LysR family regulator
MVLQGAEGASARSVIMLACQQAGFSPRPSQEASLLQTVVSLVQSGLGVALVPSVTRLRPVPGVVFKKLTGKGSGLDIGISLVWLPQEESRAARRFRELAVSVLQPLPGGIE